VVLSVKAEKTFDGPEVTGFVVVNVTIFNIGCPNRGPLRFWQLCGSRCRGVWSIAHRCHLHFLPQSESTQAASKLLTRSCRWTIRCFRRIWTRQTVAFCRRWCWQSTARRLCVIWGPLGVWYQKRSLSSSERVATELYRTLIHSPFITQLPVRIWSHKVWFSVTHKATIGKYQSWIFVSFS